MRETLAIIAVGIVAASIGFMAFTYSGGQPVAEESAPSTAVYFRELAKGGRSTMTRRVNYLVATPDGLATLWKMLETTTEQPTIDFNTHDVIAVFAGEQPTAGHEIVVTQILDGTTARQVIVGLTEPGASCLLAESLTQPYQIIEVPKTPLTLTHEDVVTTTSCIQ